MVIWLKAQPKVLAVDTDVIRAEDVARMLELSDALAALDEVVQATMHAATERARELVEAARREADAFVDAAKRKFDNSARLGYAAGHRRAIAEAHARFAELARGDREQLQASSDRLARLVMRAVEQVVAETDRDALMRRVALAVARSIDDSARLTVTVAPGDEERAKRLFGEIVQDTTPALHLEVLVDDEADEDTCVCEWDYGVVESNLRTQLAGLERALANGAQAAAGDAPGSSAPGAQGLLDEHEH
ncbi:type III secretion system stator protein SctL [Trinickia dinghuensis]|uniref:Type 3 secretion system stator protein n=1 Tax=Trinickia dinghuensis TaxID=2291023 RepID=A0A3D8K5W5_9BURK|nr:type III secretion system stator protein SctL [Trinickia dinghuensis]RDV00433.1 HrpE/YscL family type III secretion apparatus protein [Trinickia dinghuensis]